MTTEYEQMKRPPNGKWFTLDGWDFYGPPIGPYRYRKRVPVECRLLTDYDLRFWIEETESTVTLSKHHSEYRVSLDT